MKAPPNVDAALRSRVQIFFQAHVDGKPRIADQVVADDSKDLFFEIPKPRYLSFEIQKIEYSDGFTKAKATVNCEEEVAMMGLGTMKVKMPRVSTWKLEDGEWFWYLDKNAVRDTPFGPIGGSERKAGEPSSPFQAPKDSPTLQGLTGRITVDKNVVSLAAPPASDTVTIKNGIKGWVKVVLEPLAFEVPGLELKLDKANVRSGDAATLSITYDPKGEKPSRAAVDAYVLVEPFGTRIPIQIVFAAGKPGGTNK